MIILFSGYTIVLFLKGNVLVNGHSYTMGKREGKKLADCKGISIMQNIAGRFYKPIPDDLDSDIEYLDFSSNAINELKENAFEKYGNLIWLSLHDTTVEYFANYSFKPLMKLEELDISAFEIFHGGVISIWPPKIRNLNISSAKKTELNVADLAELELIDVSHNSDMRKFPVCNMRAPVHTVILDEDEICDKEFTEEMLTLRRNCIGEEVQAHTYNFLFILVIVFLVHLTLIPLAFAFLSVRQGENNSPESVHLNSNSTYESSPIESEKDEKPEDDAESEKSETGPEKEENEENVE